MSSNRDSVVTDEIRLRMVTFANKLMSEGLRVRHDAESAAHSAEVSANLPKNSRLWDLPPEDFVRCMLQKTRIHVMNRVGHETAKKRDFRREVGTVDEHVEGVGTDPDPAVVVEWKDFWDWVQKQLEAENHAYGGILDLLRQGKTNAEIADEMSLGLRGVQRMVVKVHDLMRQMLDSTDEMLS